MPLPLKKLSLSVLEKVPAVCAQYSALAHSTPCWALLPHPQPWALPSQCPPWKNPRRENQQDFHRPSSLPAPLMRWVEKPGLCNSNNHSETSSPARHCAMCTSQLPYQWGIILNPSMGEEAGSEMAHVKFWVFNASLLLRTVHCFCPFSYGNVHVWFTDQ